MSEQYFCNSCQEFRHAYKTKTTINNFDSCLHFCQNCKKLIVITKNK